MNFIKPISPRRRAAALVLALAAPLVAGCGSDRPVDYQAARTDNGYSGDVTSPPMVAQDADTAPAAKSTSPLTDTKDPLVQASGLDIGAPDRAVADPKDPLTTPPSGYEVKPLDDNTPTVNAGPSQTDAQNPYWLRGHVTTDHSHWLRGSVMNAHLRVRVNNVQVEDLRGPVDSDISQYCRKGFNTVTFLYEPSAPDASVRVDLIESEHNPPIPPLATFDSSSASPSPVDYSQTNGEITRTDSFVAK